MLTALKSGRLPGLAFANQPYYILNQIYDQIFRTHFIDKTANNVQAFLFYSLKVKIK